MTAFALRLLTAILCAAALASPGSGLATDTRPPARAAATAEAKKPRPIPFRGKLSGVNPAGRTLSVGKRVFVVTAETKIYKSGRVPARLEEGQINGEVTGSYYKLEDGRLAARSVYFGGKGDSKTGTAGGAAGEAE